MKKILVLLAAIIFVAFDAYQEKGSLDLGDLFQRVDGNKEQQGSSKLQRAYENQQSDLQIQDTGVVVKVLRDDLKGSRHQKFILKTGTQTVLVAHNIDLAPRIAGLKKGDTVAYYGEYEWNSRGGVLHWTHKDPRGRHIAGWLKHKGRTYQ